MPLTLLRQDDDIRNSDAYDDTVAPSLANYETNPASAEDDLNNVRSQLYNLLKAQTGGNWYDDLLAPSTFEGGAQRGVNNLNQDLHDLERKRVLRCVWGLDAITIASAGDTYVILGAGELPGNTTAAVGAVTTQGTVVAAHAGTFGTASLDEVSGATAISPKNLVQLVDATTRDPLLDAGDQIYGLLQSENAVDGHTITAAASDRVQISFVKINGSGTDLIAITSGAMDGVTFDYCYVERVALEDLNEQDFLGGASVDVPAGATVTRQVGYDNQGATPVDLTNNATLDLEGAGLIWTIRDDLEADLFRVVEGSAGGTSAVNIAAAVDTFDVDAVANDFANGASFDTAGTAIQIAETAGVIERAADLEIRASGSGELYLDDSNQPGSWAQTAGVKLSDTSTEWSDYETAFGGEVSLLNAIVQAYNAGADPVRTFHVQNVNEAANQDIGGPGTTANNLDVDWPDEFVTAGILNTWIYLNGRLMRPGADASANHDYYPGTSFVASNVEVKFERATKSGDQYASVYWP